MRVPGGGGERACYNKNFENEDHKIRHFLYFQLLVGGGG